VTRSLLHAVSPPQSITTASGAILSRAAHTPGSAVKASTYAVKCCMCETLVMVFHQRERSSSVAAHHVNASSSCHHDRNNGRHASISGQLRSSGDVQRSFHPELGVTQEFHRAPACVLTPGWIAGNVTGNVTANYRTANGSSSVDPVVGCRWIRWLPNEPVIGSKNGRCSRRVTSKM
jgi:hypothetical protein